VSIEDRVRAATRARTDLVRDVRPLELPDELVAPARRSRPARRWLNWGAPIGAAALVTALALVLVMLRQADTPPPAPAVPASGSSAAASIPRYYVALAQAGGTSSQLKAVVGDDRTGRTVAVLNPSSSQNFYGVTGAADDRTFVVTNYTSATKQTTWYLLRLTPGAAHPTQLTTLPIKPLAAHVSGLALSPDARELAVMWRTATTATNAVVHLSVYSVSSGATLGSWSVHGDNEGLIGGDGNGAGLSWFNGDRGVAFRWPVSPTRTATRQVSVRAIDVTAPGHDLLTDSRLAMQVPIGVLQPTTTADTVRQPCDFSLAAGDGAIVCGTGGLGGAPGQDACHTVPPSLVGYSPATGKPLKVLYRYRGQCLNGRAEVLWTDPSGRHVITLLLLAVSGVKVSASDKFGVVADGRFAPLPALVVPRGAVDNPGGIAF
jgi:hypothetical protein